MFFRVRFWSHDFVRVHVCVRCPKSRVRDSVSGADACPNFCPSISPSKDTKVYNTKCTLDHFLCQAKKMNPWTEMNALLDFCPRRFLIRGSFEETFAKHIFSDKANSAFWNKLTFLTKTGSRTGTKEHASCSRTERVLWSRHQRKYAAYHVSASWMRNNRSTIPWHTTRTWEALRTRWQLSSCPRWRQWNDCWTGSL